MRLRILLSFILLVSLAPQAAAAPAGVPGQMTYQGVLLDDQGAAQTGPVSLTVRIWDEATNGTLLYKQEFPSTTLSAGTFTLVIGPTGAPSDVPTDPLTTNLPDVFSGDLVSGPNRFFELTAGGDPALGRIQILSSPLAMRAESAANADTADSAVSSQAVVEINGYAPGFFSELMEHGDLDGPGPPPLDPSEGLADTDGDGRANFIDPDNDGDGLTDGDEVAQGSDINLITPTLSDASPPSAVTPGPVTVTLSGTNFEPGMSVAIGASNPVPTNVTPTSADVSVSSAVEGLEDVTVTRLNGESDTIVDAFEWMFPEPTLTSVDPSTALAPGAVTLTLTGTNFEPGMTVALGVASPVPATNVTATSAEVEVSSAAPTPPLDVTVTLLNAEFDTLASAFQWLGPDFSHGVPNPSMNSFSVRNTEELLLGNNGEDIYVDTTGDRVPNQFYDMAAVGVAAYGFDTSGSVFGVRCLGAPTSCQVASRYDTTGDEFPNTGFLIETLSATTATELRSSQVASGGGNDVFAYVRGLSSPTLVAEVAVAVDYNDDDDYADTNELVTLEAGLPDATVEAAVTSTGTPVVMFDRDAGGSGDLRLAVDLSGDGDYDDTVGGVPEIQTIGSTGVACYDVAVDGSDRVGVVYQQNGAAGVTILHDRNGDGDFGDAGESQTLSDGAATLCRISAKGNSIAVAASLAGVTRLHTDVNDDGLFVGPLEILDLGAPASVLGMASNPAGEPFVATEVDFLGPF